MSNKLDAQDYADITNLYHCYNHCSDEADAEGYANCFLEDGEHHLISFNMVIKGRANLRAFKKDNLFRPEGKVYRRHWSGSLYLKKISAEEVHGRCYLLAFNGEPGSVPEISDCGVYDDVLKKVEHAWFFAKRRLAMDGSQSVMRKLSSPRPAWQNIDEPLPR